MSMSVLGKGVVALPPEDCSLVWDAELQIASIVNTSQPKISIEFVDVQKQCGSSGCGVYAIAYATALSLGQDLGSL